jgi:hypothetical protein
VNETLQTVLTIGTPIAAIALSYGGIRSMVKSLQKDFTDLSNKVTALEIPVPSFGDSSSYYDTADGHEDRCR